MESRDVDVKFVTPTIPLLNEIERQSSLWQKLKAHLEWRREYLREKNDRPQSQDKTDRLRGAIGEVTYMLSLAESPKSTPPEEMKFPD